MGASTTLLVAVACFAAVSFQETIDHSELIVQVVTLGASTFFLATFPIHHRSFPLSCLAFIFYLFAIFSNFTCLIIRDRKRRKIAGITLILFIVASSLCAGGALAWVLLSDYSRLLPDSLYCQRYYENCKATVHPQEILVGGFMLWFSAALSHCVYVLLLVTQFGRSSPGYTDIVPIALQDSIVAPRGSLQKVPRTSITQPMTLVERDSGTLKDIPPFVFDGALDPRPELAPPGLQSLSAASTATFKPGHSASSQSLATKHQSWKLSGDQTGGRTSPAHQGSLRQYTSRDSLLGQSPEKQAREAQDWTGWSFSETDTAMLSMNHHQTTNSISNTLSTTSTERPFVRGRRPPPFKFSLSKGLATGTGVGLLDALPAQSPTSINFSQDEVDILTEEPQRPPHSLQNTMTRKSERMRQRSLLASPLRSPMGKRMSISDLTEAVEQNSRKRASILGHLRFPERSMSRALSSRGNSPTRRHSRGSPTRTSEPDAFAEWDTSNIEPSYLLNVAREVSTGSRPSERSILSDIWRRASGNGGVGAAEQDELDKWEGRSVRVSSTGSVQHRPSV